MQFNQLNYLGQNFTEAFASVASTVATALLTGLFSVDAPRGSGDKLGTIFTMPAPKISDGQKIAQNFSRFLTTSDLIANISGTDQHIKNRKSSLLSTTLLTLGQKIWHTLVYKRKSY